MKLLLVHLSDLHFREPGPSNPSLLRTEQIAAAVGSLFVGPDVCLVVVSGDVAFSGRKTEYDIARQFIDAVTSHLSSRLHGCKISWVFVPGNHDCDFTRQTSLREIVLEDVTSRQFDASVVATCLEVQTPYWEFIASLPGSPPLPPPGERSFIMQTLHVPGIDVQFHLLNTAMLSRLPERQGALLFPVELLPTATPAQEKPALTISVLHHPYIWLESSNARSLRKQLESSSDIILTGHEHESGTYHVSRPRGEEVEYVEGAVLQDLQDTHSSGFNVIIVDLDSLTQQIHHFSWDRAGRYQPDIPPSSVPFVRTSQKLRGEYALQPSFEQQLGDPGAPFTHSAKPTLNLEDIFVWPDVRVLTDALEDESKTTLVSDGLLSYLLANQHVILFGPDKSGKSTLAKMLFQYLRKRGVVPLLIEGVSLKKPSEASVQALVNEEFSGQYSSPDFTAYTQLPSSKRAIIVDDLHLVRLNTRGRDQIIMALERIFDYVILIGGDPARFDDLIDPKLADLRLWEYRACEILPLGYLRRSDLVKKWVFLGRSLTHDERELLHQAQVTERLIDELVSRWIYPSYPLFILVLLQQLEANKRLDLNSTSGSYGFLYESLLTIALTKTSHLRLDLDTQYSYLSEFAYFLFTSLTKSSLRGELYEWHQRFCETFGRRLDPEALLDNFVAAGVLVTKADQVTFKYPYLYYYFLGRYFRDHIDDEAIRSSIAQMAARLHNEEAANVLLFLTYLSKNPLVLKSIIRASKRLFAGRNELDLERDTAFLGPLLANIPSLVVEPGDPEARRQRMLARRDKTDLSEPRTESSDLQPYEEIETDDVLEDILKVNVAFKTIQMLGQVLRNYPGSLRASDKLEITQEVFSLGLRVLNLMMNALEENKEDIVKLLQELIERFHPAWADERVNERIGNVIFGLTQGIAVVVIKHVADSTGDETLSVTFDQIMQAADNISYDFIDLSIRLFHFTEFPEQQTVSLLRKVHNKPFPLQLLRQLVWYYFYLYHARHDLIESICTRLGIEVSPLLLQERPKLLPGQ